MNIAEGLWSQTNYLAPFNFLIGRTIVEYDLKQANISILYFKGIINKQTYDSLSVVPKIDREVAIGRMIRRDKSIYPILEEGIMMARKALFDILGLTNDDILIIKNDAVYVIYNGQVPPLDDIILNEYVRFVVKGVYDSFYKLGNNKFYYSYDPVTKKDGVNVDGLGDYGIEKCSEMIDLLCEIFYIASSISPIEALKIVNSSYRKFINLEFPIDCYRRLDSFAKFDLKPKFSIAQSCYQADILDESFKIYIDPRFNANVFRDLASYYIQFI